MAAMDRDNATSVAYELIGSMIVSERNNWKVHCPHELPEADMWEVYSAIERLLNKFDEAAAEHDTKYRIKKALKLTK